MTFPESQLDLHVEMQLGGVWTDLGGDPRGLDGTTAIEIKRGRGSESGDVEPGTCTMTLDNRSGKYSRRSPLSPYYGQLGLNTPLRVYANEGESYLSIADFSGDRASTPDTAALDITGDIDVRIEFRLDSPFASGTQCLIGKYDTATNQRSWRLLLVNSGLAFAWSSTGADFFSATSSAVLPIPPSKRLAVRATLDVNDGAGGCEVRFWWAPTIDGPWTPVGEPQNGAFTTSVFASTAPLDVGQIQTLVAFAAPQGQILAAEVRNGINGTVVATPDFTAQTPGATSFADSTGLTWTLAGDATISNRRQRFIGEVSEWPAEWTEGGKDSTVNITASGVLRRYQQPGDPPIRSALTRAITDAEPLAYWPMEDEAGATQAASGLEGGAPLAVTGLTFGSDDTLPAALPLPTAADTATLKGTVTGATAGGWHAEFVYRLDSLPAVTTTFLRANLSGAGSAVSYVRVRIDNTAVTAEARDNADTVVATGSLTNADALDAFAGGVWRRLQLFSYVSGGTTNVCIGWRAVDDSSNWFTWTSYSGAAGAITGVQTTWSGLDGMAAGHLSAWDTGGVATNDPGMDTYDNADEAWAGETALARMSRVGSAEDATLLTGFYDGDQNSASEAVGPMLPAPILDVIRSAANVDDGVLFEPRDGALARLNYRDRATLYNQAPTLTIDYTGGSGLVSPLQPIGDDQTTLNDLTVQRESGSSGRYVQETGPRNVQLPSADPEGVGRYADSLSLNLATDAQCYPHAAWRVHKGVVDEDRFPLVKLKLQSAPSTITAAAEVDVGDRVQIVNVPWDRSPYLAPEPIDLIVVGYTERLAQFAWEIDLVCVPASPYTVGVVEDVLLGHVDTDGSELYAAATSSATELEVLTTDSDPWTVGSLAYTGETATAVGYSATADYLVCADADAADITVGDEVRLFTAAGDLREPTVFEVTALPSAFGFTNVEFTPDAAAVTAPGEELRVLTTSGHGDDFPMDLRVGGEIVTCTGITSYASDSFTRSVSNGWGTATSGQAWTSTGEAASDRAVNGTRGTITLAANVANTRWQRLLSMTDCEVQVSISPSALATGNSFLPAVLFRYQSGSAFYRARLRLLTTGAVQIEIVNVTTVVGSTVSTGLTYAANDVLWVRARIEGQTISARVWKDGTPDPITWHVSETIPSGALTSGDVGVTASAFSGNTNVSPVLSFDSFEVLNPQRFTVTRAVNGIEKAQSAGADIALAYPSTIAL
ncbi:hypothetical protein GCM10010400_40060 [Streptomyces aculeolatus]|uniref:hypothetical protein n=1 Tax=Streptomyces aculeolatus TaxID=270689 RepID=UPI001CEC0A6C|nr:hypothetical protein [Streptomyces aculeolatus]